MENGKSENAILTDEIEREKSADETAFARLEILKLTQKELDSLSEYSLSIPTDKFVGNRWKRKVPPFGDENYKWYIGEYTESEKPATVGIRWYEAEILPEETMPAKSSEKSLTAGRELDLLVQEKVLKKTFPADRCPVCGWTLAESQESGCMKNDCSLRPSPTTRADEPPAYSSLINMAWIVVEHLRRQGWLVVVKEMPDGFPFEIGAMVREGEIKARAVCELGWMPTRGLANTRKRINCHPFAAAESVPLAICLAALNAAEAEEK